MAAKTAEYFGAGKILIPLAELVLITTKVKPHVNNLFSYL
jgi:hypothetical protein